MATIQLHSDCPILATLVSNKFIDEYMADANGEFVKVYLYLLRHLGNHAFELSISAIADNFNHTEKDVVRALKYWERMKLLHIEYSPDKTLSGIHMYNIDCPTASSDSLQENVSGQEDSVLDASAPERSGFENSAFESSVEKVPEASNITPIRKKEARRNYTLDEVKAFRKDPNISELFFIIETYLKHPLSSTDTNTILFWYDSLHFSPELIEYLVEYCISKGHSSTRYMDKVAMGWHESSITSVEEAKENAAIHSQAYYGVVKALGISGRNLVDSEIAFVNKWSKEYAFDLSLIQEACSRTIAATHQPSFEYTDTILSNWYKNGVHTLEDVKNIDASFSKNQKNTSGNTQASSTSKRNRFNNFEQRDYDFDELEKMLLTTSVQ